MASRVLVATDGSEISRRVANFVVRMTKVLPLKIDLAQVVDMHLVEYKMLSPMYVDMIREGAQAESDRSLQREAAFYQEQGVAVTPRSLVGLPGQVLCDTAAAGVFSLLILGRKGKGGDLQDLLFGSVSNHVVHHCDRPTLVVKARGPIRGGQDATAPLRILVAVDGSEGSQRGLDFLRASGWGEGVDVTLLYVVDPGTTALEHLPENLRFDALQALHKEGQELLDRSAAPLREVGLRVSTRVEEGAPAKTICRIYQEDEFEITVLGRRGLGALQEAVFGSVSNYVLHHCPGHVLVAP